MKASDSNASPKPVSPATSPSRRQFLRAAGAIGFPTVIPGSALGKDGATAPSERVTMAIIGTGGRGRTNLRNFMSFGDCQVIALCDLDVTQQREAFGMTYRQYGNDDCQVYSDFREVLQRDDLDAVTVSTPDHWHALVSIAAANAKKDIYCEKPLTNSIGEGRALVDAVERNGVRLQTGSHERSNANARFAAELARNGYLGELKELRVALPTGQDHHLKVKNSTTMPKEQTVPKGFDYDFWLGHTPEVPYYTERCHFWWRFILAYGGGEMTDRGAHVIDLGMLGAELDGIAPTEIEATGTQAPSTGLYDAFMEYEFTNTFPNGLKLTGTSKEPDRGVTFVGSEAAITVRVHGCKLETETPSLLELDPAKFEIKLGRSPEKYPDGKPLPHNGHHKNFIDCVKSRKTPMAPVQAGHSSAVMCHLNNIAMKLGRPLKWNQEKEQFVGDDEANSLITPKMRAPWTLG